MKTSVELEDGGSLYDVIDLSPYLLCKFKAKYKRGVRNGPLFFI